MRPSRARLLAVAMLMVATGAGACGGDLALGSDVLWTAGFEGGTLDEWTDAPGGAAGISTSAFGTVTVSSDHAHGGQFAAKLSIDPASGNDAGFSRKGTLPSEAYYSAWYYVPRTVDVGGFWVILKFRRRDVIDDPSTEGELFDVGLANDANGEMTLRLYDHRVDATIPLRVAGLIVPVGVWFQVEAYYRNASDSTGMLQVWFNGEAVADVQGVMTSPTAWIEWDVLNLGQSLTSGAATLYVDDCAISQERVGPTGHVRN